MDAAALSQIVITALVTSAATWAAVRVELRWMRRDMDARDKREADYELRLRRAEIVLAKMESTQ